MTKVTALRKARETSGYTQTQMGAMLGICSQSVYNWENRPESLPLTSIAKWTEACAPSSRHYVKDWVSSFFG